MSGSIVSTGEQRDQPDHGAHASTRAWCRRPGSASWKNLSHSLHSPHTALADVVHRLRDLNENARRTYSRCPEKHPSSSASSSAIRIIFSAEHRHPGRPVGLIPDAPGRQRPAAVEHRRYYPTPGTRPGRYCALGRPCGSPTKRSSASACGSSVPERPGRRRPPTISSFDLEHPPRRPGMDGRVHIAEMPLVSRDLSVGMHVVFSRCQQHAIAAWRRPDRSAPASRNETPDPTPRTTDTPTCPASI